IGSCRPQIVAATTPAAAARLRRAEGAQDLAVLGKASGLMLREHGCPVGEHVELPLAAGNRLRVETFSGQLGRETRGRWVVAASGGAVVDLDHAPILACDHASTEAVERIEEHLPLVRIARERLAKAPLSLGCEPQVRDAAVHRRPLALDEADLLGA